MHTFANLEPPQRYAQTTRDNLYYKHKLKLVPATSKTDIYKGVKINNIIRVRLGKQINSNSVMIKHLDMLNRQSDEWNTLT